MFSETGLLHSRSQLKHSNTSEALPNKFHYFYSLNWITARPKNPINCQLLKIFTIFVASFPAITKSCTLSDLIWGKNLQTLEELAIKNLGMFSQALESWCTGFSRNCCYSSHIWAIKFRFHQQYLHFFHGGFNRCVATSKNVFLGKLIDFLLALQSNKANNAEKCVVCTDFSLYCKSYFSKTTFIFFFKVTVKTPYFGSTMRTKLIYFFSNGILSTRKLQRMLLVSKHLKIQIQSSSTKSVSFLPPDLLRQRFCSRRFIEWQTIDFS